MSRKIDLFASAPVAQTSPAPRTEQGAGLTRRAALGGALFGLPLALAGCGWIGGENSPPLPGTRINVMSASAALEVDPSLTTPVSLPPPVSGLDWPQQGGNATHDAGIPATPPSLSRQWMADIGEGTAYRHRIPCPPVVSGGRVYAMSARGEVSAFAIKDGAPLWKTPVRPKHSRSFDVGGGVSSDGDAVFAATGFGEVLRLDAKSGKILWRSPIDFPARSAPTIAGGRLFVSLLDSSLAALDAKSGSLIWRHQARSPQTAVLGLPAPAVSGSIVVAGFGSGDLLALNVQSGEVLWSDNLGATGSGLSQLSAIVGMPVISQGRIFVGSLGGIVISADLPTGRRLWERDFATDQTTALAGDWLFQLATDQRLGCISASTGQVKWVHQMQPFKNMKKLRNPIYWWGPVLAGSNLVLVSNQGELATVDPITGKAGGIIKMPAPATVAPIAAEGRVLVTLKSGDIIAYG
ncbi:PQQ-binding-like beta-propeller repeat protein [Acidisoma sp. C75]